MTRGAETTVPCGPVVPSLVRWDLSADADLVYRTLVSFGPSEAPTIAKGLGLSAMRTRNALEELSVVGAARPGSTGRGGAAGRSWRPAPPDQVVATVRQRRMRRGGAGDTVRRHAQILTDADLGSDAAPASAAHLQALVGLGATRERIAALAEAVRWEHLSIHPEPAFSDDTLAAASPIDHALLSRGIRSQLVCLPPADGDTSSAHARELIGLGVESRYASALPLKLMVFDRKIALIPIDPKDLSRGALEVTDAGVVASLLSVFRREWSTARDPRAGGVPPIVLSERDEALLTLLTSGHTDESAARRLGISPRTVTYVLRAMMDRLGVENRFQLGLALGARSAASPPAPTPDRAAEPEETS